MPTAPIPGPTAGRVDCRGHALTGAGDSALTRLRREHVGCSSSTTRSRASLRASRAAIDAGTESEGWLEVKGGLSPGYRVVLHPDRELEDGQRVRVRR